ncbi:hypothetical protein [Phyllobacterium sp. K27]
MKSYNLRVRAIDNEDGKHMLDDLERLLSSLIEAQTQLITMCAKSKAFPDNNTLQKIATLELNIAAVETAIANLPKQDG